MIYLVDTSIWIDHLHSSISALATALDQSQVLVHPMVVGELACGSLRRRQRFLADLQVLPETPQASDAEVLQMIEIHKLYGLGLGWIDMHLLAASRLNSYSLWTSDKTLRIAAHRLGVGIRQP